MEFRIRKAVLKDVPKLTELAYSLFQHHEQYKRPNWELKKNILAQIQRYQRKHIKSNKSAIYVAVIGKEIVGHLMVEDKRLPKIFVVDREAYVHEIFIKEKYRNMGISQRLLKKAEEWAKKRKLKQMALTLDPLNSEALVAYKKFGMFESQTTMRKAY
jgi:GNAT superfamily N-acetyltransferase